jgi:hypothetical protein
MESFLEQLLVKALKGLITEELVKHAEASLVAFLKAYAASTPSKLDDAVVEAVANALGVPYVK